MGIAHMSPSGFFLFLYSQGEQLSVETKTKTFDYDKNNKNRSLLSQINRKNSFLELDKKALREKMPPLWWRKKWSCKSEVAECVFLLQKMRYNSENARKIHVIAVVSQIFWIIFSNFALEKWS